MMLYLLPPLDALICSFVAIEKERYTRATGDECEGRDTMGRRKKRRKTFPSCLAHPFPLKESNV